ncbi:uncharacterized protein LOC119152122 isoform X1 [Falco rusticolus]|uniref:uncharacterized protein LOC119152122 isoform X1 n=1 Tax=Falco rusticolus TaxID=120794 RepID=UPI00188662CC|nr:uncharacterized protein LOC119152122 isoform X1 [Falco rusticolus]
MRRNDVTPKGRGFRPRTFGLRIRPRKVGSFPARAARWSGRGGAEPSPGTWKSFGPGRAAARWVHPELYVDKSRGAKLKVATGHNTCVFIDRFPWSLLSDLSVDAMDVTGEQQQDVEHKPFKQRLDKAASLWIKSCDSRSRETQPPALVVLPASIGITWSEPVAIAPYIINGEEEKLAGSSLVQERHFESDQVALHAASNFFCCLEKGHG